MRFTKASVAALKLPAGKSDHFVWDDATPGFGVRLRGDKRTWVAQLRVDGRTRRMAIGDLARIELEPARVAARKFFAEATLGRDPIKSRQEARAKAATTVGAVIEKYLTTREGARPSTLRHQRRYLREYCKPLHGHALDAVTRRDVADLINDIAAEHGVFSGKHCRSALSKFYTWALKEGIAGENNPVAFTNDPAPGEKPRDRVLKPEEIRAIWRTLPDTEFGNIVRLMFLTACRRQEIGSLEWSEIDFDKALLVIPGAKTKNHRTHRLPLVDEAIEILKSIPRRPGNPFVFGSRRGFSSFSYCQAALVQCLTATGAVTEDWRLHDIRRTVRSELGDLGVEPWIGEQILNHARAGIEGTYNWSRLEKQMRTALTLWADRLRSIIDGTESTVVALRAWASRYGKAAQELGAATSNC